MATMLFFNEISQVSGPVFAVVTTVKGRGRSGAGTKHACDVD